jgi:membrane associated rhomboid family serine protease
LPFVAAVALINVLFFFGFPEPVSCSMGSVNPASLLLFQFSHFDVLHLIENLLGLVFTAALAVELDMKADDFIPAYFVGIFAALPLLFVFPGAAIAGNSTGIFAALAASLLKARKLVSVHITYPLAMLFIFSLSITSAVSGNFALSVLKTDIFHFAGFMAGAAISISMHGRKIFRGVYDV